MRKSMAQKVRDYMVANPDVRPVDVATKLKVKPTYVYILRSQMKKAEARTKQPKRTKEPKVAVDVGGVNDVVNVIAAAEPSAPAELPIVMYDPVHDPVTRPAHYTDGGIETIDFIEAKGLGYHLGNAVKYISRAGKKGTNNGLEDLKKAQWYIARAIEKNEYANPTR